MAPLRHIEQLQLHMRVRPQCGGPRAGVLAVVRFLPVLTMRVLTRRDRRHMSRSRSTHRHISNLFFAFLTVKLCARVSAEEKIPVGPTPSVNIYGRRSVSAGPSVKVWPSLGPLSWPLSNYAPPESTCQILRASRAPTVLTPPAVSTTLRLRRTSPPASVVWGGMIN